MLVRTNGNLKGGAHIVAKVVVLGKVDAVAERAAETAALDVLWDWEVAGDVGGHLWIDGGSAPLLNLSTCQS
jgi:hypothetical protein